MRRYQRGLVGLIELLIYAGIALAVAGFAYAAWLGFENWVAAPRVKAAVEVQRQEDQKINDALEVRVKIAEGNYGSCTAALATQATQITKAQEEAGKAQAVTAQIAQTARAALAGNAAAQAQLAATAAALPKAQACEVELKEADAIGRPGALKRRGSTP